MSFFAQQLATYAAYHRDARNRATHFVGIPAIVFSLLVPLALWPLSLFGLDASAAWVVAILAVAGWVALDVTIGLAMAVVMLAMLLIAEWVAGFGTTTAWVVFAIFFVGGWIF
ncbi:MAG TPA: Mpo1-like protein, partial [Xanthobacteraceae bacterium]|nr:Mpo1-like protein [Xanthobacteraceae bacterium]